MTDSQRVPLVLVGGLADVPVRLVADRLCGTDRATAYVHHDLRRIDDGVVRRHIRLGACEHLATLQLAHGCVSCTLREDLLPLLRGLARQPEVRRIVVRLDAAMAPERVCRELHNGVVDDVPVLDDMEIEAVVTALDQSTWFAAATGDDSLREHGLHGGPDDDRTLAQLAVAQVEFADVVVLAGTAPDAWTAARTGAVLERLAPSAALLELSGVDAESVRAAAPPDSPHGLPRDPHGWLVQGEPPLQPDCGVELLTFEAQRPFHPLRLHEAIDVLLDGVVRTRGRAWVASRPDEMFWIESAGGGLGIRHAGPWLASPHGPAWEDVSAERRTVAALRWHPVWGDRAQELVILTHRADPAELEQALRHALLTDRELADGREAWARYPDPFGTWHTDPCDDAGSAAEREALDVPARPDELP
ncbi:ribosome hibernation factor-recruiting GTPase MRF [Prauserella oleivorans]|uniref:Ribosome hibernation factor-recruiting GTPase MRF n=1 Tax=Prauserella oleivorans TaxID=1478153 RepID=A0ABW5WC13_9PSEU